MDTNQSNSAPTRSRRFGWDIASDTWCATDALGRRLPGYAECGPRRPNRTVGVFYFNWLGANGTEGPFDNSKIIAANPDDPQYGPHRISHWWGEPEAGYYLSTDPWCIHRNLCMLADAQVDVVIFDTTNGPTYREQYTAFCEAATKMRANGEPTPAICFMTWSASPDVVKRLYEELYSENLYPDLWFRWKGKPLILGRADDKLQDGSTLQPRIKDFFTWRECWFDPRGEDAFAGHNKWTWGSLSPQGYAWNKEGVPEQVSVSAACHPTSNHGRSNLNDVEPPVDKYRVCADTARGLFFEEQWKRAIEIDPEFVFITGWNEWQATRFLKGLDEPDIFFGKQLQDGETVFVDQYNQEFSRDIEPMKDGHTDNYYYQMVSYIRRYKGANPPQPVVTAPITIDGCFDDWEEVSPEYRDHIGDTIHRDCKGYGDLHYVNETGRNDFMRMKVSVDAEFVYFYVETKDAITSHTDTNWMMLLIDADRNAGTGWFGYDYLVNGEVLSDSLTTVRKNLGGWNWSSGEKCQYQVTGNKMEIAVPRAALGLAHKPVKFDFKWVDNIQGYDDIAEFSVNGDAAPGRRFNYRYGD